MKITQLETPEVCEDLHLVDGDIIAYRCSAATDGRYYKVGDVEIKYKKDVMYYCKINGIDPSTAELCFDPEPFGEAEALMKEMLKGMPVREIYLSDKRNFRYDLFPEYKKDRRDKRRPENLAACKEWLIAQGAIVAENKEADDAIVIRSVELDKEGVVHKMASIDKDIKQKHGVHWDFVNLREEAVSEAEARKNLWTQICSGDPTDSIASPYGLGPKRALAFYKKHGVSWEVTSDSELYELTLQLYRNYTPQEDMSDSEYLHSTEAHLNIVASLVYLLRSHDDEWKAPEAPTEEESATKNRSVSSGEAS